MRTIIDIERRTWANVKHFATVNELSLNVAVQSLLEKALTNFGYQFENGGD
jgi:hypothetical protein